MTLDQQKVANFQQAQRVYEVALAEAATLRRVRDDAVLALREDGATLRDIAAATGLSLGRVQQIVNRARRSGGQ